MDPSMHFKKANTELLLPVLLPTPNFTSKLTLSFIPNITEYVSNTSEYPTPGIGGPWMEDICPWVNIYKPVSKDPVLKPWVIFMF